MPKLKINSKSTPLLATLLGVAFFSATAFASDACTVIDTYGDYIKAKCDGEEKIFTLAFLNLPVEGQPYYMKSQKVLSKIRNARVAITIAPTDHETSSAILYYKGRNLNVALLASGFAYLSRDHQSRAGYKSAQEYAEKHKLGVWSDPKQIHPHDYIKTMADMAVVKKELTFTPGMKKRLSTLFVADKRTKIAYPAMCQKALMIPNFRKLIITSYKSLEFKGYKLESC